MSCRNHIVSLIRDREINEYDKRFNIEFHNYTIDIAGLDWRGGGRWNQHQPKCDGEVRFGDVFHVSWRAEEAFAVSKGLTIVDLDGGKTGEEMASDRQYPGGRNG
jgi:hypothetical protein